MPGIALPSMLSVISGIGGSLPLYVLFKRAERVKTNFSSVQKSGSVVLFRKTEQIVPVDFHDIQRFVPFDERQIYSPIDLKNVFLQNVGIGKTKTA